MAEGPERELTPQEILEILRDSLRIVGEQMRNFSADDSDQGGFAKLFEKQERLKREIEELQDSIIPAPGGTISEYSITSTNKPKR